jgi:LDH2 family malate/lactate/ureidoglycolate dehydrogenase
MWNDFENPQNVGHCFSVMDVKKFQDIDKFKDNIDRMIRDIKESPTAQGVEEIFLPGEIEHRRRERFLKEGIPLGKKIYEDLLELGKRWDLRLE